MIIQHIMKGVDTHIIQITNIMIDTHLHITDMLMVDIYPVMVIYQ